MNGLPKNIAYNIQARNKASLILMDYPLRQRLRIWAEAKIVASQQSAEFMKQLQMPDYEARIDRLVMFTIQVYDSNCPQHITPRYMA